MKYSTDLQRKDQILSFNIHFFELKYEFQPKCGSFFSKEIASKTFAHWKKTEWYSKLLDIRCRRPNQWEVKREPKYKNHLNTINYVAKII